MKKIALLFLIILPAAAAAQKIDTVCERLSSIKKINNSFYLLNLGGKYPNQKLTVVLKGRQDAEELYTLIDSPICVAGVKQIYKGKPELVVNGRFNNLKK